MEVKAPYLTDAPTDADVTWQALALLREAGITPRRLLLLAQACQRVRMHGWGRVVLTWANSLPDLLVEEQSHKW